MVSVVSRVFGRDSVPWDFQVVPHPHTGLARDSCRQVRSAQRSRLSLA